MSSKAKQKREKRRAETEAMNARVVKLKEASENPDNLADLPMFRAFNKNGLEGTNTYYKTLPEELKEWVYDLTKRNMFELYEKTWGWNESRKKKELYADWARYCVLRVGERPVGFINLKFEIEQEMFRIYLIEFQIEPEFQRHGLGRFLMQSVEFIGLKRGAEAIMLTVFNINTAARAFYSKMKYAPGKYSPSVTSPGNPNFDYDVLCKSLVKSQ